MKILRIFLLTVLAFLTAFGAQGAVIITVDPQPLTRVAGDLAVFSVQATGAGTLTFQWRKDGAAIPEATNPSLTINPVAAGDAATYSVAVSDTAPSTATSAGAALTLRAAVAGDVDFSFVGRVSLYDGVYAVAVQGDGKVIIGGNFTTVNGAARRGIARFNSDGTLDTSFGNGLGGVDFLVEAIAVQSDGKVVIVGFFFLVNGTAQYHIARLNSDGTLDASFGNGLPELNESIRDVVVQSNGKVLIGGGFTTVNGTTRGCIARLNSDGMLDTSFGNELAGADGRVYAIAVQSDGKVVIGGHFITVNGTARAGIARLNSDGTLDTSFGNGLAGVDGSVYGLAVQSDGKVIIGGAFGTVNGVERRGIARLNSDGTLDTSFGNGLAGPDGSINAVVVQSDGKVLLGGNFTAVNGAARGYVARLLSAALPDIAVAQGGALTDGVGSVGFGTVNTGSNSAALTFTITNPGAADLTSLAVTKDGANASEFTVSSLSATSVAVGAGTATFTVAFSPSTAGAKTAALHIASNVVGAKNPFDISLTGTGQTAFSVWATSQGVAGDPHALGANGVKNLLNFGSGVSPLTGGLGELRYAGTFAGGGTITATGLPQTRVEAGESRALFVRRKNYAGELLTYTPQFSADLATWASSGAVPVVLADDGVNQIVSVPYQPFIGGGGVGFFRLKVTLGP